MPSKLPRTLLILTALTTVGFAALGQFLGGSESSTAERPKAKKHYSLLLDIAKYREWTLVNPTPVTDGSCLSSSLCYRLKSFR